MQLEDLYAEIYRDLAAQCMLNGDIQTERFDTRSMSLEEARFAVRQLVVHSHVQAQTRRGLESKIKEQEGELETTGQNLERT